MYLYLLHLDSYHVALGLLRRLDFIRGPAGCALDTLFTFTDDEPTLPSIDKHSHSRACGLPLLVSEDLRRQRSRKKG